MKGRRVIVGLCMLSALAISAFVAQGASAAVAGTTLFTCKKSLTSAGEFFSKAHCKEADTSKTGEWGHVKIAENETTEITGTTEGTSGEPITSSLVSTQSGVEEELQSTLGHILPELGGVKSWVTNAVDPVTKEHYYHGELWLRFTGVTVTKPAGKGCVVKTGEVTTNKLKFTSKEQKMEILFEPAAGAVFAEFTIEGCTIAALNGLYKVEGKVKAETDGTTVSTTIAGTKAQGTLKLRGQLAGFASTATVKAKAKTDVEDTPISATTVETP